MEPYKFKESNWEVLLKYPLSRDSFYRNLLIVDFKMHPVHSSLFNLEILDQNDYLGNSMLWNKLCSGSCTNLFILNEGFNYRLIYEDYRTPFISSLRDILSELGMELSSYEYYVVTKRGNILPNKLNARNVPRYEPRDITEFRLLHPKLRKELDFQ